MGQNILSYLKEEFSVENISTWLKEAKLFYIHPKRFLNTISQKGDSNIIIQYCFYGIIYLASLTLIDRGRPYSELWRPGLYLIVRTIPIMGVSALASYIVVQKSNIRKIIIFVISVNFLYMPFGSFLYSLYLINEDNFYRLLANIVSLATEILNLFVLSFSICKKAITGFLMFIVVIVLFNILPILSYTMFYNDYTVVDDNPLNSDVMTNEYSEAVTKLKRINEVPDELIIIPDSERIYSLFTTYDLLDTSLKRLSHGDDSQNRAYIRDVENNVSILKTSIDSSKFERNKRVFRAWLRYFERIERWVDVPKNDTNFILSIQGTTEKYAKTPEGIKLVGVAKVPYDSIQKDYVQLSYIHNRMYRASAIADAPLEIFNGLILYPCRVYFEHFPPKEDTLLNLAK